MCRSIKTLYNIEPAVTEDEVRAAALQVVRKVSDPSVLPFIERTRHGAAGIWGHYSPGRLDARCFTLTW